MAWSSLSYKIRDGFCAHNLQEEGMEGFRGLYFREMVPPDAPNCAWKLQHDDIGMECKFFSFSIGQDMLVLIQDISDG
jgi:hypothetical protein